MRRTRHRETEQVGTWQVLHLPHQAGVDTALAVQEVYLVAAPTQGRCQVRHVASDAGGEGFGDQRDSHTGAETPAGQGGVRHRMCIVYAS